jgi:hypothetical protein
MPRRPLRSLLAFAALLLAALAAPASEHVAGETYFGHGRYIEYRAGDLPLVLTAGHGGELSPDEIPDRTRGVFATDRHTIEVALAAYDEIVALTGGRRPHLVICHLKRRKLDVNRPLAEAAQGHPLGEQAWHEFHNFIASARASVVSTHARGLLVDLHGHGHAIDRVELGYALGAEELDRPDADLDRVEFVALSTLRPLSLLRPGLPLSRLVRGPLSLGDLLTRAGFPAWPSPQFPRIGDAEFFRGGYIVRSHSRLDDPGPLAAIQAELPFPGLRDTEDNRSRFAAAFATSVLRYLNNPETFAFTLPLQPPAYAVADNDPAGCGDDCGPLISTSAPPLR